MFRILLITLLFPAVMHAGEKTVPEQLQKNFEKIYPYVTDADWKTESNRYVVTFTLASRNVKVYYDLSGNMLETSTVANPETLPASVLSFVSSHYTEKIRRAEKVTDAQNAVRWRLQVGRETLLTCDESGNCTGN